MEDEAKFRDILDQLVAHKEDSQQRNWAVHEDFHVIKELLENLVTTMVRIF